MSVPVQSGFLRGSGIEAEIIPGRADWPLLDPTNNTLHIDARLNLKTTSGEAIYIQYAGVLKADEKSAPHLATEPGAKSTEYGDHEWFVNPVVETSEIELKWVESASFVAEGRWIEEEGRRGIEYEIYRVRASRK